MNWFGRMLIAIALLAVVGVGAWMFYSMQEPEPEPKSPSLLEQLIPQPTPTIYPSSSTVIRSVKRLSRGDRAGSSGLPVR
jgi:hypothetical protein